MSYSYSPPPPFLLSNEATFFAALMMHNISDISVSRERAIWFCLNLFITADKPDDNWVFNAEIIAAFKTNYIKQCSPKPSILHSSLMKY